MDDGGILQVPICLVGAGEGVIRRNRCYKYVTTMLDCISSTPAASGARWLQPVTLMSRLSVMMITLLTTTVMM